MPVVKPISGHTSVRGAYLYLTRDGRALATDLFNLSWDEDRMEGYDEAAKDGVDWAAEMDFTRAANGNDRPYRGQRARTYKHYILSPDPADDLDLAAMREFARAWTRENFPDHECAIVYHADNGKEIMHAHVVVNNTNLATGGRLRDPDPRALKRSAQRLAQERRLSFFVDEPPGDDGFAAFAGEGHAAPATRQQVYYRRAEQELLAKGSYSWVADIRARVTIAKRLSKSEPEFLQLLATLDVDVSPGAPRQGQADWVYSLSEYEKRRVRGENLGVSFGKRAVETGFRAPPQPSKDEIVALARDAIEIGSFGELEALAETVDVNARYNVGCAADYAARIEAARGRGDSEGERQLLRAQKFDAEKKLLPPTRPQRDVAGRGGPAGGDAGRGTDAARASEDAARRRRQHEALRNRDRRRTGR